jgi:predicted nucleic acid-binding protein
MAILVDSSVLIDVVGAPGPWADWSEAALRTAAQEDILVISPVIYSEVSMGFDSIEALDAALPPALYRRDPIPLPAAFLAGRCFLDYRRRGGSRTGVLPDFFIGAHAAVAGYRLLTRDARQYRTYFPTLQLIAPD